MGTLLLGRSARRDMAGYIRDAASNLPRRKAGLFNGRPRPAHDALLSNRHEKGTQDEEIIPVRVLGFDEWKGIEPDPSDPELIQHFFSEWTKARIKKIQEYDVRRGIVDPQKDDKKDKGDDNDEQ